MTLDIPTIETERLILRGFTPQDFDDYVEVRIHPDNAKWLGSAQSKAQIYKHMMLVMGHWAMRGYGRFCVRRKDNDAMVGIIGALHPFDYPTPEMAYAVHPDQKGNGFAGEAVKACLKIAYQTWGWTQAISMIDPDNHASQSVARKCGATATGEIIQDRGYSLEIWQYPSPEAFFTANPDMAGAA